jgi:predicted PurR-regulated permease PerM
MASISNQNFVGSYNPKPLCQIVGLACIAGFLIDVFALTFPPAFGTLEWRVGFLQQLSDRSVILLFGLALFMYGLLEARVWRKRLAMFCLVLGVVFLLSSVLVIRDGVALQQQAANNISNRAAQLQTQLQDSKSNPQVAGRITPEQLNQVAQQLTEQAASLKQNAQTGILKTGVASVGNFVVVGLALIGMGRYGARPPKA